MDARICKGKFDITLAVHSVNTVCIIDMPDKEGNC